MLPSFKETCNSGPQHCHYVDHINSAPVDFSREGGGGGGGGHPVFQDDTPLSGRLDVDKRIMWVKG